MNELKTIKTGDNDPDTSPIANVGKRFYTWATLGTFAGATFLVGALWRTLKIVDVWELEFEHPGWPLFLAAIVMIVFAFATEPVSQKTTKGQKAQKAIITLANTLLVFFTVIGSTGVVRG